jgi:homoprotocatechuate degradation regulator HpaR
MRYFRPMLAEHDLTEQQWRVLRALTAAEQPVDAGYLAEQTFLLPPSLSRILANLEERGLITRDVDPDDQRRALITLDERGAKQVAAIAPESELLYGRIEATFGVERLNHLLEELHAFTRLATATAGPGTEPTIEQEPS